jgi:hypothetical protein
VDISTNVNLPGGGIYPLLNRPNVLLLADGYLARNNMTQFVPANAPGGTYIYNGYVRDHNTLDTLAQCSFTFMKLGSEKGASNNSGWSSSGWDKEALSNADYLPVSFNFNSPHPNPFNSSTMLSFALPKASKVSLIIYDIQGRETARLVDGWKSAGAYNLTFDASQLSSGIYFAKLTADNIIQTQKLLLLK